jgi:hypothetical protein
LRCGKEELTVRDTCMICGIPGEVEAVLVSISHPDETRTGMLCGICRDEFQERAAIRDWSVRSA